MYMEKKKIVWDLCSGLGGWTEAFVRSEWIVYRFEVNPELYGTLFTRIRDVTKWLDWVDDFPRPDLIVASPPCTEFSTANPISRIDFDPDMSIVRACLDIIDYVKPQWWVLENVKGACPYIRKLIGHHKQFIGPFYLWGNFPSIEDRRLRDYKKDIGGARSRIKTAQEVAKIPYEMSFQLKRAVETQTQLSRWS